MSAGGPDIDWPKLGMDVQVLFTPAAPISRKELFAMRSVQLGRLLDAVAESGRHAILYGERGVGKTSLANVFHQFFDNQFASVFAIRKQVAPDDTYSSLWKKVFRELTFQFQKTGDYGSDRSELVNIANLYPDEITADDVVRELSRDSGGITPVIIFDEFDRLLDAGAKRTMSHTIKALSDTGLRATMVLVGVADDINTLVAEHESIIRNISEIKMPRMAKDQLNSILSERYQMVGMRIDGNARWKIVTLSRGLPEYVHALGRAAALKAISARRTRIMEADVDTAIRETLEQSDQSANNAYKRAIDSNKKNALYRQVLLACALTKPDDEGKFAPKDVVEPLSGLLGRKVEIANFQSHLGAFCDPERGSILERLGKERAYKYRFREPKMQPYVLMQGIGSGAVGNEVLAILSAPEQPRLSSDF